jgi:ribonucleoside-diphosphate reductase alpha chain
MMQKDEKALAWLNDNELCYNIWDKKYRYNNETFDEWLERVSAGNQEIAEMIKYKRFMFGGRTLANRGTGGKFSYSNCYSHGFIEDNMDDIMDASKNLAMTYKRGGGQGLSLSKIRPKGSLIGGRYPSDGIVPFMELFNQVTATISQGGSRKGALLMALDVKHPQIMDFIKIKETEGKITNANLSVEIDNEFMAAVVNNRPLKVYNFGQEYEINAPEIFEEICKSAMKSAEPGVIFTDKFRNYNIMQYVDDYQIEICNPCGEQPLPKHGACSLCSLNISEYIIAPFTAIAELDTEGLKLDVRKAIRAMDDLIDENLENHALPEQREISRKYRNVGLGILGLADAFIKMGYTYGDTQSQQFARFVMNFIFSEALDESVKLAEEKGSFPGYTPEVWDSEIIKNNILEKKIEEYKKINKLRNCALISIAPTGSIGTMLQASTGCEPNFAFEFNRKTVSLDGEESVYKVKAKILQDYIDLYGENIPSYFVTAQDIDPVAKVKIQQVLQLACDTAISSTCNLKRDVTLEDVKNLYIQSWKRGLKGQTIYVEGSRDPILFTETKEEPKEETTNDLKRGDIIKASNDWIGVKEDLMTGCGSLHVQGFFDQKTNELREIYLSKGSTGGCMLFQNGLSRMISLAARGGISTDDILDQLKSCGSCPSYAVRKATKGDTSPGACCPGAVGLSIRRMRDKLSANNFIIPENLTIKTADNTLKGTKCPSCGEMAYVAEQGCGNCYSCGFSRCS